ncbi:MAG: hypothetical protein FI707_02170 [SAR202 cluster bacterium]|jgi:DNA mismatch repair protein MutS2|nr:hypothetical protein [Chloroflexota bacterium]MDP6420109.1 Smr/MutS family protein [SAR202 cluster bacterium]HAL49712.1 hypothetical protein [Dehalococcoidia bacterium]MDP6662625.1 Smr/MutS family protein [SAR202 cluster bacterium]MDP6798445.1 Smr/MutS family protein [SAR202 cluster bacterium]|tara:strand:+ start:453 stop:749 length:297 start_codon:yes stop_codon:yes gene_type:complete
MTSNRRQDQPSRLMKQANLPTEVHLRQMKVRAALDKLDRYLNDAAVAGFPRVRVVHGKGTGTMKRAVAEFLAGHPLVARQYPASPSEGNGGVTIAELA